jgi:hypothetical protein
LMDQSFNDDLAVVEMDDEVSHATRAGERSRCPAFRNALDTRRVPRGHSWDSDHSLVHERNSYRHSRISTVKDT